MCDHHAVQELMVVGAQDMMDSEEEDNHTSLWCTFGDDDTIISKVFRPAGVKRIKWTNPWLPVCKNATIVFGGKKNISRLLDIIFECKYDDRNEAFLKDDIDNHIYSAPTACANLFETGALQYSRTAEYLMSETGNSGFTEENGKYSFDSTIDMDIHGPFRLFKGDSKIPVKFEGLIVTRYVTIQHLFIGVTLVPDMSVDLSRPAPE
eukprot:GHVS01101259.1.p1 GENE.GHVS01101259.1~~GHVS01101259.1.p1  ORF type:complete len:207 (+),score=7.69 GHVS01101259.1:474-1094(+)